MVLLVAPLRMPAQNVEEMREYRKKAECLLSFTRFIEWPEDKLAPADEPFFIGVYGVDRISPLLLEALQGRSIKGRSVIIRHLLKRRDLRSCHVLFISRSEQDRLRPILRAVRKRNILTVGECDNFLLQGGVLSFVSVGNAVRFRLNPEAAAREELAISSRLQQLALPGGLGLITSPQERLPAPKGTSQTTGR